MSDLWGAEANRAMLLGIARNRIRDNRGKEPFLTAELTEAAITAVENAIRDLEGGNADCALNHLHQCLGLEGAEA